MAKLETWEGLVKQYRGAVVAWINQAEAPNLKEVNSQGVCNAIVKDWLASYRKDQHARQSFVAKFAAKDSSGQWLNTCVPDSYIDDQQKLSDALKLSRVEVEQRQKKIAQLKKQRKQSEADAAELELWQFAQRAVGGPDCRTLVGKKTFASTMQVLTQIDAALYIALSLTGTMPKRFWEFSAKSFGHVVGLEFRPAYNLFEFIDANLGLFAFVKRDDMLSFVQNAVWPRFYQPYPITTFALYMYEIGPDDFGITQQELESRQRQRKLKQIERDMARLFAEIQSDLDAQERDRDADSNTLDPVGENESKSEINSKSEEGVT